MDQLILDFLGPVAGIPMALAALWVWLKRRAIGKAHVVSLVVLTAVGLTGFLASLLAAWGRHLPESLVMPLLHVTAWMTAGGAAGFTVAFWLLWFGRSGRTGA